RKSLRKQRKAPELFSFPAGIRPPDEASAPAHASPWSPTKLMLVVSPPSELRRQSWKPPKMTTTNRILGQTPSFDLLSGHPPVREHSSRACRSAALGGDR
ncbi:hypothetical protein TorRG33x02_234090, partial [Trema orientale]